MSRIASLYDSIWELYRVVKAYLVVGKPKIDLHEFYDS